MQGSIDEVMRSWQKSRSQDDELTKLRNELGELKEELEAQGKLLQSIQQILDGLKANGGSLDNAVVKIDKSARDNVFNVSDMLRS
jgi:archaellum component FlaC